MAVISNIAAAATAGTPAVAYTCPASRVATVNVHVSNVDTANPATFTLYVVPASVTTPLNTPALKRAATVDLVQLVANGGQLDRSGISLAAGDTIQYDTGSAANIGIVIDGIVGAA